MLGRIGTVHVIRYLMLIELRDEGVDGNVCSGSGDNKKPRRRALEPSTQQEAEDIRSIMKTPTHADMLVAYSTTAGKSWLN